MSSFIELKLAATAMYKHLYGEDTDTEKLATVMGQRANRARNALKHFDAGGNPTVNLDVRDEAIDMLDRAITNYWRLEESVTPAMDRFWRQQSVTNDMASTD